MVAQLGLQLEELGLRIHLKGQGVPGVPLALAACSIVPP
jgi:hypothetical protein